MDWWTRKKPSRFWSGRFFVFRCRFGSGLAGDVFGEFLSDFDGGGFAFGAVGVEGGVLAVGPGDFDVGDAEEFEEAVDHGHEAVAVVVLFIYVAGGDEEDDFAELVGGLGAFGCEFEDDAGEADLVEPCFEDGGAASAPEGGGEDEDVGLFEERALGEGVGGGFLFFWGGLVGGVVHGLEEAVVGFE